MKAVNKCIKHHCHDRFLTCKVGLLMSFLGSLLSRHLDHYTSRKKSSFLLTESKMGRKCHRTPFASHEKDGAQEAKT